MGQTSSILNRRAFSNFIALPYALSAEVRVQSQDRKHVIYDVQSVTRDRCFSENCSPKLPLTCTTGYTRHHVITVLAGGSLQDWY